jgi:putative pyruvate formate lyase activating enzyme
MKSKPSYIDLYETGELDNRIKVLWENLSSCTLCPRDCKVNRLNGEIGFCKGRKNITVSSYGPHYGEEESLVGFGGSGTIFLTHCNLGCIFCQNYEISHLESGNEYTYEDVAQMMISLQKVGCHNINLVTPTHYIAQILQSLKIAIELGLNLPLVYNCGGYESEDTIKQLEGVFDIYMPDAKFGSNSIAEKYTGAKNYVDRFESSLIEMYRQVGNLKINGKGVAERGLLIRHLVMPENLAGSDHVLEFIANKISKDSFINIMSQYRPCYKAYDYPELLPPITSADMVRVLETAKRVGLQRSVLYSTQFLNKVLNKENKERGV